MKRIWTLAGVIALVMALSVTVAASAQNGEPDPTVTPEPEATTAAPAWGRYVDEDGDGICDFAETGGMYGGHMMGWGVGYVDEDGDGVCDNCPEGYEQGQSYGRGVGMMGRGMMGRGMWGFGSTDDDDDSTWTRPGGQMGRGMYGRSWGPRR